MRNPEPRQVETQIPQTAICRGQLSELHSPISHFAVLIQRSGGPGVNRRAQFRADRRPLPLNLSALSGNNPLAASPFCGGGPHQPGKQNTPKGKPARETSRFKGQADPQGASRNSRNGGAPLLVPRSASGWWGALRVGEAVARHGLSLARDGRGGRSILLHFLARQWRFFAQGFALMSVDGYSFHAHSGILPVAALVASVAAGVSPSGAPPARTLARTYSASTARGPKERKLP
jgi:hypothetical protein